MWLPYRPTLEASRNGKNLVAYKMETNPFRAGTIIVKCGRRFDDVGPQFFPCVGLGENVFRQTLSAITTVGFLDRLEY